MPDYWVIMVDQINNICAERLKVLAEGNRINIVRTLMQGPKQVGSIARLLDIEQSLLSHHLRILRDAGFVDATRSGKSVIYSVSENIRSSQKSDSIELGCCQISFD